MDDRSFREQSCDKVVAILAGRSRDDRGQVGRRGHRGCASSPRTNRSSARRPSSNDVAAANPNRSRARRCRAPGAAGRRASSRSQRISPSKPVSRTIRSTRSRIVISCPTPEVDRLRAVVALGGEDDALRRRRRRTGTRATPSPCPRPRCGRRRPSRASTHFLISAGITCEEAGSKLSPGPVQVDRDQIDDVEAVLRPIGLALDEQHLLGQAVRGVGLLRVAVPEVVLVERHRRELRVGADRPDRDELVDAGQAGGLHQLDAHDRVLVEEPARVLAVGADAADDGGEVDDDVRAAVGEGPVDAVRGPQVVVAAMRGTKMSVTPASPRRRTTAVPRNPPPPVTMTRRPARVAERHPRARRPHARARGSSPARAGRLRP